MTDEQAKEIALSIEKGFEAVAKSIGSTRNLASAVELVATALDSIAKELRRTNDRTEHSPFRGA